MKNIFAYTQGDGNYNWIGVYVFESELELPLAHNTGWSRHRVRVLEARLVIKQTIELDIIRVYAPDTFSRGGDNGWALALPDAERLKAELIAELEKIQ